jgi:HSP20 family protein
MSEISLQRVANPNDRSLPVFAEVERVMRDIERRARELCAVRGYGPGHALDDWLDAEREFCWPVAQMLERDRDYLLSVALPGYEVAEIELTVTPRELIVHARHVSEPAKDVKGKNATVCWSEFRADDVYRRIELPTAVDVAHVKASLRNGLLKVTAPKTKVVVTQIPIASAA